MPLDFIRGDITKLAVDAIVDAANNSLLGGGGVDGAIHRAAGSGLLEECRKLNGCETGHAKLTKGYKLPAKHVIHTVGPIWYGGNQNEPELLRSCYEECLKIAADNDFGSIAFPLISAGTYGYPKDEALRIAVDTCSEFLMEHDMEITIVIFDRASFDIGKKFYDIQAFIDDNYVDENGLDNVRRGTFFGAAPEKKESRKAVPRLLSALGRDKRDLKSGSAFELPEECCDSIGETLDERLSVIDESFSEMLMRKIDERGMTDAECYKKANIDRKLFSKIRSNRDYHPKKNTAVAFAIALELDISETRELLMKAGFALSHSNRFDIIIEYFIERGDYRIYEINEALFKFDQVLLGS